VRIGAILATHAYGAPCDVDGLAAAAAHNGIRLFFDAAPAFGARYKGVPVGGFGDAEVFSLTPTKVLVAGEGGIIATNDSHLAESCHIGRDYGHPGDYDCRFVGLSARMSEFHAAVALRSFEDLEERIEERNELARRYRDALDGIPGLSFPLVRPEDRSTYKDFTVLVEPHEFGLDATGLEHALAVERIETRRYYSPAVHRMLAYRSHTGANVPLPVTETAASQAITIPLWTGMSDEQLHLVAEAIRRIRKFLAGQPPVNGNVQEPQPRLGHRGLEMAGGTRNRTVTLPKN
jgi:dTDP-4-amino-4,6-dideoxygalactose transaminase